jgi:uncharacterized protein (DUF4415 family)
MGSKNAQAVSAPETESPEWTAQEFEHARPALDVVAEVFGTNAAEALKRGRGRPPKTSRKVNQTLRLDPDVLEAYRLEGSGWQARINDVLRAHMPGSTKRA